jgi:hypothetical protein
VSGFIPKPGDEFDIGEPLSRPKSQVPDDLRRSDETRSGLQGIWTFACLLLVGVVALFMAIHSSWFAEGRTAAAVGEPVVLSDIALILFAVGPVGFGGSGLVLGVILRRHRWVVPLAVRLVPFWWEFLTVVSAVALKVISAEIR